MQTNLMKWKWIEWTYFDEQVLKSFETKKKSDTSITHIRTWYELIRQNDYIFVRTFIRGFIAKFSLRQEFGKY